MGDISSTRVDLVASTAPEEDAVDWLRSVGFVEICVPLEEENRAPAQRAPSESAPAPIPRRGARLTLALGVLAVATGSGCASARWVAPLLDTGSSVLALSFAAASTLAGAWFGARASRAS